MAANWIEQQRRVDCSTPPHKNRCAMQTGQIIVAPRQGGGRGVLHVAADLGVWSAAAFWIWVFLSLVSPTWPATLSDIPTFLLECVIALLLGGCMAFVTPALWSAVLPGTSAGMLLQAAQRRTLGFVALLASSLYLAYLSFAILRTWWESRPNVAEGGLAPQMTIISLIFFIVVPALAWSWSTPSMWLHEIEQAHKVRRIEQAQEAEMAIMKGHVARAIAIATAGLDQATAGQRQYVADVMVGLHRWRNEQLRQVVDHISALTGVESALLWKDDGFVDQLDRMRSALTANYVSVPEEREPDVAELPPPPATSRQLTPPAAAAGSPSRELPREPVREAEPAASAEAESLNAYRVVCQAFGLNAWKRDQVERVLDIKQTKALALIREWVDRGWVETLDNPKHHYQCVGGAS